MISPSNGGKSDEGGDQYERPAFNHNRHAEPILKPVIARNDGMRAHNNMKAPSKHRVLGGLSVWVRNVCVVGALLSFALSLWAFFGFVETDFRVLHLLQAACICFGLGALAYGPLLWAAWIVHKTRRHRTTRGQLWGLIAVFLPWLGLAGLMFRLKGVWVLAGVVSIFMALIVICWAAWKLQLYFMQSKN